jgi:hypothetical protein
MGRVLFLDGHSFGAAFYAWQATRAEQFLQPYLKSGPESPWRVVFLVSRLGWIVIQLLCPGGSVKTGAGEEFDAQFPATAGNLPRPPVPWVRKPFFCILRFRLFFLRSLLMMT